VNDDIDHTTSAAVEAFWARLQSSTQARIGLGRAGNALPTRHLLQFAAAHASARDAVHTRLDLEALEALEAKIQCAGLGAPTVVTSQAASRNGYLRRPDLGRLPKDLTAIPRTDSDIGFVIADGLSPRALLNHGLPLLCALRQALSAYTMAAPIIATHPRVALGDPIAMAMGASTVIVLIGERPGLSVADSVGIYLTHRPRIRTADSERNCISNIHPPEGLAYDRAAHITARLVIRARGFVCQTARLGLALCAA
jgi:ethanolamine ammonia-lyase small subunit